MKKNIELTDITAEGTELSEDELKAVLGGLPRRGGANSSKVCDVDGGCWTDSDF